MDTELDDDLNRYPTVRYLDNSRNVSNANGLTPIDNLSEFDVLDEIDK
jgi:hypothetical protein